MHITRGRPRKGTVKISVRQIANILVIGKDLATRERDDLAGFNERPKTRPALGQGDVAPSLGGGAGASKPLLHL